MYFILVKIGKHLRIHQCLMGKYIMIKEKLKQKSDGVNSININVCKS